MQNYLLMTFNEKIYESMCYDCSNPEMNDVHSPAWSVPRVLTLTLLFCPLWNKIKKCIFKEKINEKWMYKKGIRMQI